MRSTITHHFVSSFVRRVTYPKISPIGLHLAEKHASKVVTEYRQTEFRRRLGKPMYIIVHGEISPWTKMKFCPPFKVDMPKLPLIPLKSI